MTVVKANTFDKSEYLYINYLYFSEVHIKWLLRQYCPLRVEATLGPQATKNLKPFHDDQRSLCESKECMELANGDKNMTLKFWCLPWKCLAGSDGTPKNTGQVFGCAYPGCRDTFPYWSELVDHAIQIHHFRTLLDMLVWFPEAVQKEPWFCLVCGETERRQVKTDNIEPRRLYYIHWNKRHKDLYGPLKHHERTTDKPESPERPLSQTVADWAEYVKAHPKTYQRMGSDQVDPASKVEEEKASSMVNQLPGLRIHLAEYFSGNTDPRVQRPDNQAVYYQLPYVAGTWPNNYLHSRDQNQDAHFDVPPQEPALSGMPLDPQAEADAGRRELASSAIMQTTLAFDRNRYAEPPQQAFASGQLQESLPPDMSDEKITEYGKHKVMLLVIHGAKCIIKQNIFLKSSIVIIQNTSKAF